MTDSNEKVSNNVSRRGMLKWAGALAAVGVVGVGLGFGGDILIRPNTTSTATETSVSTATNTSTQTAVVTLPAVTQTATQTTTQTQPITMTQTTTVTPSPPTTISYVPPLSPAIQDKVNSLVSSLQAVHTGETITYQSCNINGCHGFCVLRVRSKNGILTAIEPDDTINPKVPIEDNVVSDQDIQNMMVQVRGCPKGYQWRSELYNPNYILYPMKQVGQKGPNASFARVSWDEALTMVANAMTQMKSKYGPYSVAAVRPTSGMRVMCGEFFGVGYKMWGNQSTPAYKLSEFVTWGTNGLPSGGDMPLIFQSKLIVLWGWDPFINFHEWAYYMILAKKKNIPIIAIDPQLNASVEVLANQWIPIRPGTDSALMLAIANVLFKQNLYNQSFVSQWVEPTGFQKWKDYVLGNTAGPDGAIDRTPQWAESICGIPADTITAFAQLYAASKPTYLKIHWSVFRNIAGENDSRGPMYLAAMTGNLGVAGGFGGGNSDSPSSFLPGNGSVYSPPLKTGSVTPVPYPAPFLCNSNADALSFNLHKKLDAGQITAAQYNAEIGNPHPEVGVPNPHMWMNFNSVFYYSSFDPMNNTYDVNERFQVLQQADFIAISAKMNNEIMVQYADVVLPLDIQFFNEFVFSNSGRWSNYLILGPKVATPPGESKSDLWLETRLAAKLGIGNLVNPLLQNVTDDQWDAAVEALYQASYQTWCANTTVKGLIPNPPTWDQLKKQGIIRVPKTYHWVCAQDYIVDKTKKIPTASNLIEFYSNAIAAGPSPNGFIIKDTSEDRNFGNGFLPPMFEYAPSPTYSFFGKNATKYPLLLISPHSYYRHHSGHDKNPIANDEWRHACWLNPADASARGIKDNDLVHVFSNAGEMIIPAYVTSRIAPGVTVVRFGAWYTPSNTKTQLSPLGVDVRGAPNILIPDDRDGQPIGIDWAKTLVQVELFQSSTLGSQVAATTLNGMTSGGTT